MDKINNLLYISTENIAEKIYNLACDMDFSDYAENKSEEVKQIEEALYTIKTYCENDHNPDYWRFLFLALAKIGGEV